MIRTGGTVCYSFVTLLWYGVGTEGNSSSLIVKLKTGKWLYASVLFYLVFLMITIHRRVRVSCVRIGKLAQLRVAGSEWELDSEQKKIREASLQASVSND